MIKDISTTALIGVLIILLSFGVIILTLTGFAECTDSAETQILTISQMAIAGVIGFFFGASHKQKQVENEIKIQENEQ